MTIPTMPGCSPNRFAVGRGQRSRLTCVALVAVVASQVAAAGPARADETFGGDPLDRVRAAAAKYADDCADTSRRLPPDQLAALVIPPTFPETGSPPSLAPSPTTPSRYDTQSRLYSYGDTSTYTKAFWTPVSGWQWDDASLQGFSASQRIDQAVIIDFTTRFIAQRWCSGRGFDSVWSPWYGCNSTSVATSTTTSIRVDASSTSVVHYLVTRFGGMEQRTCTIGGGAAFTCWFVDSARQRATRDSRCRPGPFSIPAPRELPR